MTAPLRGTLRLREHTNGEQSVIVDASVVLDVTPSSFVAVEDHRVESGRVGIAAGSNRVAVDVTTREEALQLLELVRQLHLGVRDLVDLWPAPDVPDSDDDFGEEEP